MYFNLIKHSANRVRLMSEDETLMPIKYAT